MTAKDETCSYATRSRSRLPRRSTFVKVVKGDVGGVRVPNRHRLGRQMPVEVGVEAVQVRKVAARRTWLESSHGS